VCVCVCVCLCVCVCVCVFVYNIYDKYLFSETKASPIKPTYRGCNVIMKKQCFPLYSLLLALGNPKVDYLSLDVEGAEINILRTIPWEKASSVTRLGEISPLGLL
jgi:hypothetical protein